MHQPKSWRPKTLRDMQMICIGGFVTLCLFCFMTLLGSSPFEVTTHGSIGGWTISNSPGTSITVQNGGTSPLSRSTHTIAPTSAPIASMPLIEANFSQRLQKFSRSIGTNGPARYRGFCASTTFDRLDKAHSIPLWSATVSHSDLGLLEQMRGHVTSMIDRDVRKLGADQITVLMNADSSRFYSWLKQGYLKPIVKCPRVKSFVVSWWNTTARFPNETLTNTPLIHDPKVHFIRPLDPRLGERFAYHSELFGTAFILNMDDDNQFNCKTVAADLKKIVVTPKRTMAKVYRGVFISTPREKNCPTFEYSFVGRGKNRHLGLPNAMFARSYLYLYTKLYPPEMRRKTDLSCEDLSFGFFQAALSDNKQAAPKGAHLRFPDAFLRNTSYADAGSRVVAKTGLSNKSYRSGCYTMLVQFWAPMNILPTAPRRILF